MRFYKNKDTGQILKEPDARAQWWEEYDGDDPTNAVRFFDQYSELKGRDLAITQIKYVIDTHEPADSYKYQLLDRLKTDCGYFLGAGNRNPASLWGCSVGTHLDCMRLLWDSFPDEDRPEWLTREQIEDYGRRMNPQKRTTSTEQRTKGG